MSNSFPIGGFNGSTIPGPFTSTHASGCITLRMRSDFSVVDLGYSATISCDSECSTLVINVNDSGDGSLRDAIDCALAGESVTIDPSLFEQTILINEPIAIDKEVIIATPLTSAFNISTSQAGPIFDILPSGNVQLDNVTIISGTANDAAGIRNLGTLELGNVTVEKSVSNSTPNSLIENNGVLNISGSTEVKE